MKNKRHDWMRGPTEAQLRESFHLYGRVAGVTSAASALVPETAQRAERAKPVQHEAAEQTQLSVMARREWWGRYYWHVEQATHVALEAWRKRREGQRPGWPDVVVIVPGGPLALELKRVSSRPKREVRPTWWLDWAQDLERDRRWELNKSTTSHGLAAEQALTLLDMHRAGFRTKVAYGAAEAFSWLCETIGPKP